MMMMFRQQIVFSNLALLWLVATLVNAQIAERDNAGRVSIRGGESHRNHNSSRGNVDADDNEEANDTTGDDQPVAGTEEPSIQRAWIYYFDAANDTDVEGRKRESGSLKDVAIQGTKQYIIVYKQPDDFGIAEEILSATDVSVQSTVVDNGGSIKHEYNAALNGVSASLTNEAMQELTKQDGIDFIEEVVPMRISTTWGQDRVDEQDLTSAKLDYKWERNRNVGDGVNVCVRCLST
jgi:hypothetical protein